jgi:hypothetical protein
MTHSLRTHCVSVRLSPAELAQLDHQRGQQTRGAYLRAAWQRLVPPQVPPINREAWRELARAAANLNQLAYACHIGEELDLATLRSALSEFRRALLGATP